MGFMLANGQVEVSLPAFGELLRLLDQVNLLKLLADWLKFFIVRFRATIWAVTPYKSYW